MTYRTENSYPRCLCQKQVCQRIAEESSEITMVCHLSNVFEDQLVFLQMAGLMVVPLKKSHNCW